MRFHHSYARLLIGKKHVSASFERICFLCTFLELCAFLHFHTVFFMRYSKFHIKIGGWKHSYCNMHRNNGSGPNQTLQPLEPEGLKTSSTLQDSRMITGLLHSDNLQIQLSHWIAQEAGLSYGILWSLLHKGSY